MSILTHCYKKFYIIKLDLNSRSVARLHTQLRVKPLRHQNTNVLASKVTPNLRQCPPFPHFHHCTTVMGLLTLTRVLHWWAPSSQSLPWLFISLERSVQGRTYSIHLCHHVIGCFYKETLSPAEWRDASATLPISLDTLGQDNLIVDHAQ